MPPGWLCENFYKASKTVTKIITRWQDILRSVIKRLLPEQVHNVLYTRVAQKKPVRGKETPVLFEKKSLPYPFLFIK